MTKNEKVTTIETAVGTLRVVKVGKNIIRREVDVNPGSNMMVEPILSDQLVHVTNGGESSDVELAASVETTRPAKMENQYHIEGPDAQQIPVEGDSFVAIRNLGDQAITVILEPSED